MGPACTIRTGIPRESQTLAEVILSRRCRRCIVRSFNQSCPKEEGLGRQLQSLFTSEALHRRSHCLGFKALEEFRLRFVDEAFRPGIRRTSKGCFALLDP